MDISPHGILECRDLLFLISYNQYHNNGDSVEISCLCHLLRIVSRYKCIHYPTQIFQYASITFSDTIP
jgi:hypothetical protein